MARSNSNVARPDSCWGQNLEALSDVVLCRDVASFIDDRFDNCDLLWGGVIHDRTINAAVIISTQLSKIVAAGVRHGQSGGQGGMGSRITFNKELWTSSFPLYSINKPVDVGGAFLI
jgi:hypothetical protein